ncbi:MAG: M20 aminoacylase family protein [Hyphomicrobiales bacterium]
MNIDIIARHADELTAIRRDLHMHPELLFEEVRTSEIVARELTKLGYSVTRGLAGTGVVGTLSNGTSRRSIGLRADMDALPLTETTGLPYASRTPGKMHACGHDGHTTTLLGAARHLAESRNFDGTVHLIFQPAEEDVSGAKRMIEDGLFERFPCDAVFAFHNWPGAPVGQVQLKPGAIMASVDLARVAIKGIGGHGAVPHRAVDPVIAGAAVVMALQTIVSRNIDPGEAAVITVGAFNAGNSSTIIPQTAHLDVGIRSCSKAVRDELARRIPALIENQCAAFGCTADVDYEFSYPPTINSAAETEFTRNVAASMEPGVVDLDKPFMVSEDFAYMLEKAPGCYFIVGNGDEPGRKMLHDPGYDFNDELLIKGAALWGALVEQYLA